MAPQTGNSPDRGNVPQGHKGMGEAVPRTCNTSVRNIVGSLAWGARIALCFFLLKYSAFAAAGSAEHLSQLTAAARGFSQPLCHGARFRYIKQRTHPLGWILCLWKHSNFDRTTIGAQEIIICPKQPMVHSYLNLAVQERRSFERTDAAVNRLFRHSERIRKHMAKPQRQVFIDSVIPCVL